MKRKVLLAGVIALGLALVPFAPATTGAQTGPSNVRVIHAFDFGGGGIGGAQVSVCVDDVLVDDDFRTGDELGPVALGPGTVEVEIFVGQVADCSGTPDLAESLDVPAGQDLSAVAQNDDNGRLALRVFPDDVSCAEAGTGRVVARHGASQFALGFTPTNVAVLAEGAVVIPDLANGAQAALDVPVGTYQASVAQASDTNNVVLGPLPIEVQEAVVTEVYVFGGDQSTPDAFVLTRTVEVCPTPTTTSTTAPTTTTTAAVAVQAQPRFTG